MSCLPSAAHRRGDHLPGAGEHLPALCLGPVVRESVPEGLRRRGFPGAVRRRLRRRIPAPGRRPPFQSGPEGAPGEVQAVSRGGEDRGASVHPVPEAGVQAV